MKGLAIRWLISVIALYAAAFLAQKVGLEIRLTGAFSALLAVVVLGIINALIRPIVVILTLPLNCLTLGIFTFLINGLMFWLAGQLVPGFVVKGPLAALFGSVVMGIISGLANNLIGHRK
ncbi:MAG: phage holin family protein [Armatimonadota bacterium]|nr:phage holin family protein [Armatimonadota bacterium]